MKPDDQKLVKLVEEMARQDLVDEVPPEERTLSLVNDKYKYSEEEASRPLGAFIAKHAEMNPEAWRAAIAAVYRASRADRIRYTVVLNGGERFVYAVDTRTGDRKWTELKPAGTAAIASKITQAFEAVRK